MSVTYTKLQIEADGQTELLRQTGDQTMVAKQGETSFAIRDQDGTASKSVDQKWHMISAEQVGDSGSVIWQHAETGIFRETKYSIDNIENNWTQKGEAQELNTSELYTREGEHEGDLNGDSFQSSRVLSIKGPGNHNGGSGWITKSEIMLEGGDLISSTNKIVGQFKADRDAKYSITGQHQDQFEINNNGEVFFTGDAFTPDPNEAKGPTVYKFTIKATDQSTNRTAIQIVKLQQRHVIEVTNDSGDKSEGSFGWAVELANKLGSKNIASEIRFTKSMTIHSKNGYQLTHGDVKINTFDPQNISIKRTTNGSAFTIGEFKYAKSNSKVTGVPKGQPRLRVEASNINIFETVSKGIAAAEGGGGGGGLAAGAAIMHFNGHAVWRNSVIQGNKVIGGKGAEKPKAGITEDTWDEKGKRHFVPTDGSPGLHGGHLPGTRNSFEGKEVKGGDAQLNWGTFKQKNINGFKGDDAPDAKYLGEGAHGAGNGGGATNRNDLYDNEGWPLGPVNGNPGKPGKRGMPGYGGGVGWGDGPQPNGSQLWGGFATPEKGGDGGALAVVTSFAYKNPYNSLTIRNTDALNNNAESSSSAAKVRNIHSRYINIKVDNYRQAQDQGTPDTKRDRITGNEFKNPNAARSKPVNNSAVFNQAEEEAPTSIAVRSNSFVVTEAQANIVGQSIELDPNKSHVIFAGLQTNDSNTETVDVQNWKSWRDGIMGIIQKVYSPRTEEAIRNRKESWGTWGSVGILGATKLGIDTGPAGLGFNIFKGIISEFEETKRIEKALKEREETIKEGKKIETLFSDGLKTNHIQINHKITRQDYNNFRLGTHTIEFQPGLDPLLKWERVRDGQATISINNRDFSNRTADNKAKQFALLRLTKEQTQEMANISNKGEYINSFIRFNRKTENGSSFTVASLGTQSKWLEVTGEGQKVLTGNGNDRVKIKRDYKDNDIHTNLIVRTYQGDDVVQGDRGASTFYLGQGNDYVQPGLGKDIIKGGEGIDTVSYSNIEQALKVRAQDGKISVKFANANANANANAPTMNDTITEVEKLIFGKNADIDLKGLAPAVEYSTSDPNRTTNSQLSRMIMVKEGSTVKGAEGDEKFIINFETTKDSANNANSIQKVTVDGRGGRNQLAIAGLDSFIEQGYEVINDSNTQQIKIKKGETEHGIVDYSNIMGSPKVLDQSNKSVKVKTLSSNTTAMDIDAEDADPLTNYGAANAQSQINPWKSSDSDQLILQDGACFFNRLVSNLEFEPIIQGVNTTQDPINMILSGTNNSLENHLNKHQQRDQLSQDRIDNF